MQGGDVGYACAKTDRIEFGDTSQEWEQMKSAQLVVVEKQIFALCCTRNIQSLVLLIGSSARASRGDNESHHSVTEIFPYSNGR